MKKPNYGFDRRQRELAKQQKREDKRLKKLARAGAKDGSDTENADAEPSANADAPANPLIPR